MNENELIKIINENLAIVIVIVVGIIAFIKSKTRKNSITDNDNIYEKNIHTNDNIKVVDNSDQGSNSGFGFFSSITSGRKFNLKFVSKYNNFTKNYTSFTIPKRDGSSRLIETPNVELKNIQKELLKNIEGTFTLPSYVTAFRKNFGIKHNAKIHINKKIIINIDITNFFHSVTSDKIRDALKAYDGLGNEEIEKFIDIVSYNGRLAQGAPSSPFVANLTFLGVDKMIINLLKKYDKNICYSRYADDITFSSNNDEIRNAIRIITDSLLPKFGYVAKKDKTTVYRSHTKQLVTGLVVNEKVAYPRNKYMKLRSMVYNYLKNGDGDINIIRGNLAFLISVDKKKYNKLKFYYRRAFKDTSNYKGLFTKSKGRYKRLNFMNPRTGEMVHRKV